MTGATTISGLARQVHRHLVEVAIDDATGDLATEAERHLRSLAPLLARDDREQVLGAALAHAQGLGPVEPLLADPTVTEILVNAGTEVWVERAGQLERAAELADGAAELLIERIIGPLGLRVDRLKPTVDARLADGSRFHAVIPPVAIDGPCLAIRRFAARSLPLSSFAAPPVVRLLEELVEARANLVVSGATSSGKTTLLNALLGVVQPGERVLTIEDAAELRLATPHVVRLEARPPTVEGAGEVTVRDLVRTALRLRPDRLVVGEVRGAEALDMVLALNTGHDGSLTTCHGNGPVEVLERIEAMVLMGAPSWPPATAEQHVRRSIDVVVHLGRGRHGQRVVDRVMEVAEPGGGDDRLLASGERVVGRLERGRAIP
jgi:pilus assembly protein CpaF